MVTTRPDVSDVQVTGVTCTSGTSVAFELEEEQ
jgi:hypothetical protein